MSTRRKKIYRIVALYLAFNLLAQICMPTAAFALTNGPGQPEFESFEPAGTTDMVNLFTGDFNYNIPLMTVPGPNGGYPINMAYHAGIGMEQEASWVGLGWNINAGAINRSMRGLPDDFDGDQVIKDLHYKPSTTFNMTFGKTLADQHINSEILGFGATYSGTPNVSLYYNNYRGIGFGFDYGVSNVRGIATGLGNFSLPLRLNLSTSSDGIGINVDYSFQNSQEKADEHNSGWFPKVGLSWGSREGITALSLGGGYQSKHGGFPFGGGVSFAKSGYVPSSTPEMTGFISMLGASIGENSNFKWDALKATSLDASLSRSWVKYVSELQFAYGYLNAEDSRSIYDGYKLDDINREKDGPPTRQTKTLAVPTATYDVFSVSGQGVGGVFRPYRSDIGIYTEPKVTSTIRGGKLNFEYGIPKPSTSVFNWGTNGAYSQSRSYSGMWDNDWWNGGADHGWHGVEDYQFVGLDIYGAAGGDHSYEPYYFKMSGEQTASPSNQLNFVGGDDAVRFNLKDKYELSSTTDLAVRPEIPNSDLYTDGITTGPVTTLDATHSHRSSREKRVVSNQSRTNEELNRFSTSFPADIYSTINSFPATGGLATPSAFDYSSKPAKHIGEFTEVNPDGNRYVYGIPVYTFSNKDVVFAKDGLGEHPTESTYAYTSTDASVNNDQGTDQLYSSTTLPGYATSYLLTAIYSPDYVDITGNGPSDDDLGYFVKFNYEKTNSNYKWRAPYWNAMVNAGFLSNQHDDKLSYEYGEKEIYYLHSIETKTHVACFVLQNDLRKDAHAAINEGALDDGTNHALVSSTAGMYALDHISLYSKADPNYGTSNATPLKSVYFNYSYSLCPDVPNNENTWGSDPATGKLTLNSIYFTYRNNTKGVLSPYQFDYTDSNYETDLVNPVYDQVGNDRWGNYKKQDASSLFRNNENPYVDQKTANRKRTDQSAAAWCLKKITLPSGSTISVNYEADDYAFVQDKKAMQMCRVVGVGLGDNLSDVGPVLSPLTNRVYFELNAPLDYGLSPGQKLDTIRAYIDGIDDMYFKMFMLLKKQYGSSSDAYDYVEGYCKISHANGSYGVVKNGTSDHNFGFLTVELVDRDDYPGITTAKQSNPIQKAAWQYIYLDRPDLFNNSYNLMDATMVNLATVATNMIGDIPRVIAPYTTAFARGWAVVMDVNILDDNRPCIIRPSYIRLNAPHGVKIGGGHRVKNISISDSWGDLSSNTGTTGKYGQQYSYRLPDGSSSGVASYEPMIGGDEIALRKPIRFNSDNLVKKDQAFYVEEPMGESYYPAPVVGYSRVIVKSIVGDADNTNPLDWNEDENGNPIAISRSGQTIYEFYTARDFPVKPTQTALQKTWFPIPIFLPFIGSVTYNNRGFSQGYSVVLNDMHGKLKAVSTYPYSTDLNSANPMPVRRVFYKYNTVDDRGHSNEISSDVNVLTADGKYEEAHLGETYDFFTDLRQHSNETMELGGQFNTNTNTINGFTLPVFLPLINISRSLYRSAVTMKVIYRTGILTDVETLDDGVKSSAHNLMFDAETGAPLLTTITNEFEKPVYTYNYSAHWDYDGMKGAYNNVGERFGSVATNSSGVATITNASSYFFPGDEVMYLPTSGTAHMLWVKSTSGNTVTFMDADGSSTAADVASLGSATLVISRSGHRNQQSVSNGTIVSLSNPVTDRNFPLFDALNALSTLSESTVYSFVDCASGTTIYFKLSFVDDVLSITECTAEGVAQECHATITFPPLSGYESISDLNACNFTKAGNSVIVDFPTGPDVTATWADQNHCFNECLDNVLHAAAVRFTDDWSTSTVGHGQAINFADVGLPTPGAGYNKYVFATNGVWRTQSNYLYQVDRKQTTTSTSSTDISKDGTYKNFVLYDWLTAPQNNNRWSYVSQVTRYSPYGYALESRDALGIYSATMFGYANTKQTASAANCQYFEMGYDGFEDYPSAAYPENLGTSLWGHGHLYFEPANEDAPPLLSTNHAHTGKYGLVVDATDNAQFQTTATGSPYSSTQQYFAPQAGQDYFLSVWVWNDPNAVPSVEIDNGSSTTYTTDNAVSPIEGWKQINVRFTAPAAGNALTIKLKCQTGVAYFDDIRVQPFKSAMSSNVYDPQTHWLIAELDNRNFATFYNYDSEGSLVQVKQETEKGIFTVQTSRSNIKR